MGRRGGRRFLVRDLEDREGTFNLLVRPMRKARQVEGKEEIALYEWLEFGRKDGGKRKEERGKRVGAVGKTRWAIGFVIDCMSIGILLIYILLIY